MGSQKCLIPLLFSMQNLAWEEERQKPRRRSGFKNRGHLCPCPLSEPGEMRRPQGRKVTGGFRWVQPDGLGYPLLVLTKAQGIEKQQNNLGCLNKGVRSNCYIQRGLSTGGTHRVSAVGGQMARGCLCISSQNRDRTAPSGCQGTNNAPGTTIKPQRQWASFCYPAKGT